MDIVLRLKNKSETRLIVQPVSNNVDKGQFVLVSSTEDISNPYMTLRLEGSKLIVESQREIEDDELDDRLDDLAVKLIEGIQRGEDFSDESLMPSENEERPYDSGKIRVESANFSLKNIYDMIEAGDLDLNPDFQRNLVWDNFRKSRLIESVLLRIPLPMFYFSADDSGKLSVVDGLQRLTAIKQFMDNKLVLRDLEYLKGCENKVYRHKDSTKQIDDKHYRWFNMTQIVANIIDAQSPVDVKYDIFRRLNTGGRPLNAQEIRNCLADKPLRDVLKRMVTSTAFKNAISTVLSDRRMNAQEIALRFLYFRYLIENGGIANYSGNMDRDLDRFVEFVKNGKGIDYDRYMILFENAMKNAKYLFGKHAFRKVSGKSLEKGYTSVINKALFLSWSVVLSDYDPDDVIRKVNLNCLVEPLAKKMDVDEIYFNFISYGTNGWKNIMYAFDVANEIASARLK